jgi:cell division protein FtsX
LIPLTLGLATALAVFSLFRAPTIAPARLAPALALDTIPGATWAGNWSPALRTPGALQLDGLEQLLTLLVALALVVLAAACINTAIALLSRAAERRYEIALRAMVGASTRRLLRDFIAEGALLTGVAGAAGTVLGLAAAEAMHRTWPDPRPGASTPLIQPIIALAVIALPLAVGFLFSLAPRLRMARKGWIGDALSPEARTNPGVGASDMRNLLVILQFAVALTLFTTAGLLFRSTLPLGKDAATGIRVDGLITAEIDASHLNAPARAQAYARLLHDLDGSAGVGKRSLSSPGTLLGIGTMDRIAVYCGNCGLGNMWVPMFNIQAQQHVIAPGYFDTVGVHLVQGRELDPATTDEVVINQTLAAMGFWDGTPVLGHRLQVGGFSGKWYTVVGIVRDMPAIGVHSEQEQPSGIGSNRAADRTPALYLHALAHPPVTAELVVRATGGAPVDERALARAVGATGMRVTSIASARARIAHQMAPLLWFARAFGATALVVLFLALQGLYALMHTNIAARRTELGVRRAVGASRVKIMLMVLREAAVLVASGAAIGLVVAPTCARVLQIYFPAVHLFDPALAIGALLALSLAAIIGALGPARSAAWEDPARALQHE